MSIDTLLIEPHFLPCLEYFALLLPYNTIDIELYGNYQKQTYSNRCYILSSQQIDRLTVPVIGGTRKILYKDMQIDYQQKWPICHWRAICTAYGRAPYFEYLSDYFKEIIFQQYQYLYQLNLSLLNLCLRLLQLNKSIKTTDYYVPKPLNSIVDARNIICPQIHFSSHNYYHPFAYQQVFGTIFNANLSILDLLFCKGPEAYKILEKSSI